MINQNNVTTGNKSQGADSQSLSSQDREKSLTDAVSGMLETSDVLEQDKVEGVDNDEWNDQIRLLK